jgi:UDPglucose 6-dehydrogenase
MINNKKSPIEDREIEEYLAVKELNLNATLNKEEAYKGADFVIIATPASSPDYWTNFRRQGSFAWITRRKKVITMVPSVYYPA